MDLYKEHTIQIELPKGFMNVGIATSNKDNYPYRILIADTNDSENWDRLRFPLPPGDWKIKKYYNNGKIVELIHHARRRTFFSKWY